MITFDDIVNDMFTPQEYAIFNGISVDAVDVEQLEKHGTVEITETTDDEDNVITKVVKFKSYDGAVSFTKTKRYYKHRADYEKIKELNDYIAFAIKTEDFEKAQALKKERDAILLNQPE